MEELVISLAPIASSRKSGTRLDPAAIAQEVAECYELGANIVHLHLIDEYGQPTDDTAWFQETVHRIKALCPIIIEGSTAGDSRTSREQRSKHLSVKEVEMASLNCGSCNFREGVYINTPEDIQYWAQKMLAANIKPNLVAFDLGMINNAVTLKKRGLLLDPLHFTLVLGVPGAVPASPNHLNALTSLLPSEAIWTTAVADSSTYWRLLGVAIATGGHVRTGLEDWNDTTGRVSNLDLIHNTVRLAQQLNRPIATNAQVRKHLGLD